MIKSLVVPGYSLMAMASISTMRSGCDNRLTSTVVLAGNAAPRNSCRTSECLKNSSMSVTNVVVFMRSSRLAPISSKSGAKILPDLLDLLAHIAGSNDLPGFVPGELPGDEDQRLGFGHNHMAVKHAAIQRPLKKRLRLHLVNGHDVSPTIDR